MGCQNHVESEFSTPEQFFPFKLPNHTANNKYLYYLNDLLPTILITGIQFIQQKYINNTNK